METEGVRQLVIALGLRKRHRLRVYSRAQGGLLPGNDILYREVVNIGKLYRAGTQGIQRCTEHHGALAGLRDHI